MERSTKKSGGAQKAMLVIIVGIMIVVAVVLEVVVSKSIFDAIINANEKKLAVIEEQVKAMDNDPEVVYADLIEMWGTSNLPVEMEVKYKTLLNGKYDITFERDGVRVAYCYAFTDHESELYKELALLVVGDKVLFDGKHIEILKTDYKIGF